MAGLRYAIIEGSGFRAVDDGALPADTEWGLSSAAVRRRDIGPETVLWLPRHGDGHSIPPHAINYRANLVALRDAGAAAVIGINTVGVISNAVRPGQLMLPDQLIDYTWGRGHSFFDGRNGPLRHIEFEPPFSGTLRRKLSAAAERARVECCDRGVYAVTQGPRLETAAEIDRLERDGADVVGMTAMPEAALAMELGLDYASIALAVNPAAGRAEGSLHDEVAKHSDTARRRLALLLETFFGGPDGEKN